MIVDSEKENAILIKVYLPKSFYFSVRFLLSCMIFLCVAIQYTHKIDLSTAIVCMTNHTSLGPDVADNQSLPFDATCKFQPANGSTHTSDVEGSFTWSKDTQGVLLGAYFYGYIILQIPSGWLAARYGGAKVLAAAMFFGSLATLLMPVSAELGTTALFTTRFIAGLVEGAVWPAISALFVHWTPPLEKSRLIGFGSAGSWIGNVIALPAGSFLCINGFAGGWPSIFYIFGLVGLLWCVLFLLLTADTPKQHRFISDHERNYIIESVSESEEDKESSHSIPWITLVKSKACWAIFCTNFSCTWANYLFLTQLPTFMNEILKFDIKSNGLYSSLPYIACWAVTIFSAFLSDKLIQHKYLTILTARKLFNTLGLTIGAVSTLALSFVTCSSPYLGVLFLVIGLGAFGMNTGAGYGINIIEVGGNYGALLCGITNTIATIPGIVSPYVVGVLTKNRLQSEWQVVFILSCCIYIVGALIFLVFGQSDPFYLDKNESKEVFGLNGPAADKNPDN